jgi:anaerobic selenocysteine-containing dehydrogenase
VTRGRGISRWPVIRQLMGEDARGDAARSARTDALRPRTEEADGVARSVCPYCAVGCAQLVHADAGRVVRTPLAHRQVGRWPPLATSVMLGAPDGAGRVRSLQPESWTRASTSQMEEP